MATITLSNQNLVSATPITFLMSNMATGVSTLTVQNITGFAVNQILIIGGLGNEGSEIVKTHASTAPSGNTITLAAPTVKPHSASSPVQLCQYDQVEFSTAATSGGTKSILATVPLWADNLSTNYIDNTASVGYYFGRFVNTISPTSYSSYSDPIPVDGYNILSARSVIDSALEEIGQTTSPVLNDGFAFQQINNAQMEVVREQKRWSFLSVFDSSLGRAFRGQYRIEVPNDMDDRFTNKTTWHFRLGKQPDAIFVDKTKWDQITSFIAFGELASNIGLGDATVELVSSANFDNGGTINVAGNQYQYTANDRNTNTLTLETVATEVAVAGDVVTQGAGFGYPLYWTMFDGYIYWYPFVGNEYEGREIEIDYYRRVVPITTDVDELVVNDPTVVSYYLQWKFLKKMNNGTETAASLSARQNYVERREKLKQKDSIGRTYRLKPLKNQINSRFGFQDDPQFIRDGAFPNI